jgi:hypothetical protein
MEVMKAVRTRGNTNPNDTEKPMLRKEVGMRVRYATKASAE